MKLNIIAAMTKDRVIGKDNKLLWDIKEEMGHFRKTTSGCTVIMGRKTYESIGRPLPNRNNIVVSRSKEIEGVDVCSDIPQAIEKAKEYGVDTFIIGGSMIYNQTISLANKLYISYVKGNYKGDAYFPEIKEDVWEIESKERYDEFEVVVYRRK